MSEGNDALLLLDGNRIIECNEFATAMFEAGDMTGLRGLDITDISPATQECGTDSRLLVEKYIESAARGGAAVVFDWSHISLKGRSFVAQIVLSRVVHCGVYRLQAVVRDRSQPFPQSRNGRSNRDDSLQLQTAERRLAAQNAYFRQLFEASPLGIVILTRDERIENANPVWQEMFGFSIEEVRGVCINECIVPTDRRDEAAQISARILANETIQFHAQRLHKSGKLIDVSFIGTPINLGDEQIGIYGIYTDQTENVVRERDFRRQKEVAELTLNAIADAVIRIDNNGTIAYSNQAAERLLGKRRDALLKGNFYKLCDFVTEGLAEPITFRSLDTNNPMLKLPESAVLYRHDGTSVAVEGAITTFSESPGDRSITGGVIVIRDVSDRRRVQKELAYKATHDSLTGLLNREEMERHIIRNISRSFATGTRSSLLYIDLDQFKVVNDSSGHQAGDKLLQRVAAAIRLILPGQQIVARMGGDEFAVLLPGVEAGEAVGVAENIIESIRNIRFSWQERLFRIGASIGIAEITPQHDDVTNVLAAADSACYAVKDQGRGRVKVASDADTLINQRRIEMDWVSRINHALENNRFVLYRQEIRRINNEDRNSGHWEILVRMLDEAGASVLPDSFIPAAERYGLMPTIDRWVISRVFQHFDQLRDKKSTDTYAINISGTSMSDDSFTDFITSCFNNYHVNPHHICFEITETAAAANLEHALAFMNKVRELGCKVSLDDFGSGFSSFTYLKTFAIDYLKIDGSFVREVDTDPVNRVFVESIDRIGKSLGIHTIAEYVENENVLAWLKKAGVDSAQGHFLGKPALWLS